MGVKHYVKVGLLISVMVTALLIGCTAPTAEKTPASAPAAATPAVKKVVWKFASPYTQTHFSGRLYIEEFINKVNSRLGDELTIEYFGGDSLVKSTEMLGALSTGAIQSGTTTSGYFGNQIPETGWYQLPFGTMPDIIPLIQDAIRDEANKYLEKRANVRWLVDPSLSDNLILTKNKPIRKLEDIKGLRIRTSGGVQDQEMEALGAAPTHTTSGEVYMALERGVIDGTTWGASSVIGNKAWEVLKYVSLPAHHSANQESFANLDAWNALSPHAKNVMEQIIREAEANMNARARIQANRDLQTMQANGMQAIELSSEELARFKQAMKPVWDSYAALGPLAKRVVDLVNKGW